MPRTYKHWRIHKKTNVLLITEETTKILTKYKRNSEGKTYENMGGEKEK